MFRFWLQAWAIWLRLSRLSLGPRLAVNTKIPFQDAEVHNILFALGRKLREDGERPGPLPATLTSLQLQQGLGGSELVRV